MENLQQKRKELEQKLIEKAMKDDQFRNELIADPMGTIEKETGIRLSESFKVHVLEEEANSFYLVLPRQVNAEEDELTEAELELVSGGGGDIYHPSPPNPNPSNGTHLL